MARLKPIAVMNAIKENTVYLKTHDSFGFYLINTPLFSDGKDFMDLTDRLVVSNMEIGSKAKILAGCDEKEYEKFISEYAKRLLVLLKTVEPKPELKFEQTNVVENIKNKEDVLKVTNSFAYSLIENASYKTPSKLSNVLNKIVEVGNLILVKAGALKENEVEYKKLLKSYIRMVESLNKQIAATNEIVVGTNHI